MGVGLPLPPPISLGGSPLAKKHVFVERPLLAFQGVSPGRLSSPDSASTRNLLQNRGVEGSGRPLWAEIWPSLSKSAQKVHFSTLWEPLVVRFWFCAKFDAEPWCRELWASSVGRDLAFTPSKRSSPATSQGLTRPLPGHLEALEATLGSGPKTVGGTTQGIPTSSGRDLA